MFKGKIRHMSVRERVHLNVLFDFEWECLTKAGCERYVWLFLRHFTGQCFKLSSLAVVVSDL